LAAAGSGLDRGFNFILFCCVFATHGNLLVPEHVGNADNQRAFLFGMSEKSRNLKANLIMPEPCPFLSRALPNCSIVRPTQTTGAAMGALQALSMDGLFIGQTNKFMELLADLATDADQARRE